MSTATHAPAHSPGAPCLGLRWCEKASALGRDPHELAGSPVGRASKPLPVANSTTASSCERAARQDSRARGTSARALPEWALPESALPQAQVRLACSQTFPGKSVPTPGPANHPQILSKMGLLKAQGTPGCLPHTCQDPTCPTGLPGHWGGGSGGAHRPDLSCELGRALVGALGLESSVGWGAWGL